MSRSETLLKFLEKYKNLPKQGSAEWLSQRKYTVGGSQIATIMGINKYENIKSFIKSKTDFYEFKKEAPLWFGNLMEPCIEQYVKIEFGTDVAETGSLPCEFNKYLSYSPDGLCVISKDKLKKVFSESQLNKIFKDSELVKNGMSTEELLILMEFKSPFMRKIIHGSIPEYYKPQPLLGMEIIDIAEASIFIECVFRFCAFKDIYNNKYSYYHYDKNRLEGNAIMYGSISMFYSEEHKEDEDITQLVEDINTFSKGSYGRYYKEGDLSYISDRKIINKIMEMSVDSKKLNIIYHEMRSNRVEDYPSEEIYLFNKYNNPVSFVNEIKNTRIIQEKNKMIYLGTMCYKLLDVNQIPIMKEKMLDDSLTKKISQTFSEVQKVNEKAKDFKSAEEFNSFWKTYKFSL